MLNRVSDQMEIGIFLCRINAFIPWFYFTFCKYAGVEADEDLVWFVFVEMCMINTCKHGCVYKKTAGSTHRSCCIVLLLARNKLL
jgi:hypothetical protein